jgi:hypothetical protein
MALERRDRSALDRLERPMVRQLSPRTSSRIRSVRVGHVDLGYFGLIDRSRFRSSSECRPESRGTSGFPAYASMRPCGSGASTGRLGAKCRGARYDGTGVEAGAKRRVVRVGWALSTTFSKLPRWWAVLTLPDWPLNRLLTAAGCTVDWTCYGSRARFHVGTAEGEDHDHD